MKIWRVGRETKREIAGTQEMARISIVKNAKGWGEITLRVEGKKKGSGGKN